MPLFDADMVAVVPTLGRPGWIIEGDFVKALSKSLPKDATNNNVAGLLVMQLHFEGIDLRGRIWLDCSEDKFVCYTLADKDVKQVQELLKGFAAGTLGPVIIEDVVADTGHLPSQPLSED